MGCGCKNKGNQQTTQVVPQQNNVKNQTVQESVKKVIEKYYNKK
jgi:DNA-binding protein Fis